MREATMSRRGRGGAASAYDVEAHWESSSDDEGYSYSAGGRKSKNSSASIVGNSGCGIGRHCRGVLAGWVVALGLLGIWYSEHVKLNTKIVELNGAIEPLALVTVPSTAPPARVLMLPSHPNIWRRRAAGATV